MAKAKDEESGAGRVFPAECVLHGRPHTVCRDEWNKPIDWQPTEPDDQVEALRSQSTVCDRTDLPELADMLCQCGFEAGEHPAWKRRYCRNRRYPEHGRHSPCALCGYAAFGAATDA